MDMISKLPLGIIETILCLLPIQEAARTSILSREWRYHWIKIPKIAFIEDTFQESTDWAEPSVLEQTFDKPSHRKVMTKRCKLYNAIYQVLLTHEGPIHEFTLSMEADDSCVEIDDIIRHLLKKNTVKILKLDFNGTYTLPLSLLSPHQLTDLYLNECSLHLQPSSNVFGSLTTLYIREIFIDEKSLLSLLSSCPLLKRLTILCDDETIDVTGDSTIVDFIKCLPVIEYLCIWFFIYSCFGPDRFPKKLPTALIHLKYLCMECVCFIHKHSLPFFVLLIRSAPNLEKLRLEILDQELRGENDMVSYTIEDYSDIMLEHLKDLEILHLSDEENELAVVQLILAKSPVLKNARILLRDQLDKDEKLRISKILLSSLCASPVVKIVVS